MAIVILTFARNGVSLWVPQQLQHQSPAWRVFPRPLPQEGAQGTAGCFQIQAGWGLLESEAKEEHTLPFQWLGGIIMTVPSRSLRPPPFFSFCKGACASLLRRQGQSSEWWTSCLPRVYCREAINWETTVRVYDAASDGRGYQRAT